MLPLVLSPFDLLLARHVYKLCSLCPRNISIPVVLESLVCLSTCRLKLYAKVCPSHPSRIRLASSIIDKSAAVRLASFSISPILSTSSPLVDTLKTRTLPSEYNEDAWDERAWMGCTEYQV